MLKYEITFYLFEIFFLFLSKNFASFRDKYVQYLKGNLAKTIGQITFNICPLSHSIHWDLLTNCSPTYTIRGHPRLARKPCRTFGVQNDSHLWCCRVPARGNAHQQRPAVDPDRLLSAAAGDLSYQQFSHHHLRAAWLLSLHDLLNWVCCSHV